MQRDLVERAMAGDHEAFSELARLSIGRLYSAARLILRDDAKAEDATQEALVAAWRDLSACPRDLLHVHPVRSTWLSTWLSEAVFSHRKAAPGTDT